MIEEVGLIEPLSTETWLVTACLVVGILPKFEITHANKPPASKELNLEAIWLYIYIYCIALQRANLYTIGPIPEPPKKPKTLAILALDLVYPGGPFVGSKPNCYLLTSTINTKLGQAETRNATSVHPTHGSDSRIRLDS